MPAEYGPHNPPSQQQNRPARAAVLERCLKRLEWEKVRAKEAQAVADEQERERLAMMSVRARGCVCDCWGGCRGCIWGGGGLTVAPERAGSYETMRGLSPPALTHARATSSRHAHPQHPR